VNSPSVSVCFPAYNEEASIGAVLQEARDLLSSSNLAYEILVCDDGSTDRTAAIIADAAGHIPRLRVLSHSRNLGIRATVEHLYSEACNDFVFLNSTDGQWRTGILLEMLPLTKTWDIIIASRVDKHYGPMRRVVSWGFNTVPRLLFGVQTFDAGAVKLAKREAIQRFAPVSKSPFSEAERLIRAARAGYRITQYPVPTFERRTGRARGANPRLVASALADVWRVWWSLVSRPRSPVSTEGGDAPGAQGARRAHTGCMQPTSNAAPRDAAPAECHRTSGTRH